MTGSAWFGLLIAALLLVAAIFAWFRWETDPPTLARTEQGELFVGSEGATLHVQADDGEGSGIRSVTARLRHAEGEVALVDRFNPGSLLTGDPLDERISVEIALDPKERGIAEGDAFLIVDARDWSWAGLFQGNLTTLEIPLRFDYTPPSVSVASGLTYVRRGGAGLVRYRVGDDASRDGVEVGDAFFAGYPVPGANEKERTAIFAMPRDADSAASFRVVAQDAAGNKAGVGWPVRLLERKFEEIPIRLGKSFMEQKVPSLSSELGIDASDPLKAFREINHDERARNESKIREIVAGADAPRLFDGPFLQMKNSAVTSRFAEHRTYYVDGEQVSEAIHYGYDLASVSGATIEAANRGRVIYADTLGIYGNCVILDHGLGVTSLYAHLRQIDVSVGDSVERGAALGRSGATGLAGGDHLHFAILVGETYVDPKEWWDPKWVEDHVAGSLARAKETGAETAEAAATSP